MENGKNQERAASSSNLIVVSNRLPFVLKIDGETLSRKSSAGGLVTAVAPVLIQSKGNNNLKYLHTRVRWVVEFLTCGYKISSIL